MGSAGELHQPLAINLRPPRDDTDVIQGEADERCPVGQAEQMFVTLKKAGCEVEWGEPTSS